MPVFKIKVNITFDSLEKAKQSLKKVGTKIGTGLGLKGNPFG